VIPNLRDKNVQSAVKNLFAYSLLILVLPLGSMFGLKIFLFEGYLGWKNQDAMMYSAIVAIILIYVVLGLWIRAAYKEEEKEEKQD